MSAEQSETSFLVHQILQERISRACMISKVYTVLRGGSRADIDRAPLELARYITMKPGGQAERYLNHFLAGSGSPISLSLKQLILEDDTVHKRIFWELCRKISGIVVEAERETIAQGKYDPCITLFQPTYSNPDWWFALGTFNVQWRHLRSASGYHHIELYGTNEYRWYPEEDRITRCLHESGARLAQTGHAKNFNIVAEPFLVAISESYREQVAKQTLESGKAWKPTGGGGPIPLAGVTSRISDAAESAKAGAEKIIDSASNVFILGK